jgi:hypothetical protein
MNFPSAFAQNRIVPSHHQWSRWLELLFDQVANALEEESRIQTPLTVGSVIGTPIPLGAALRAEQSGNSVPTQADQLRESMIPSPFSQLGSLDRFGARVPYPVEVIYEASFFFTSTGLGGVNLRLRMR